MKRILATILNEFRLFGKDIAGLSLLFLMPMALTVIMALIQDAPFREYQDLTFDILWVDNDGGQMAQEVEKGIGHTQQFHLVKEMDNQPLNDSAALSLVQKGIYKIGIIIPKGVTAEVVNSANQIANEIGKQVGAPGALPVRESRSNLGNIAIYFDPATKQTFKMSIMNALEKHITKIQAEMVLARLNRTMRSEGDTTQPEINLDEKLKTVQIKEIPTTKTGKVNPATNSVQHNVPAWALFGLFFIIIPIAGNMIREREEGSFVRMKLIPGSYFDILIGKVLFYVLVGIAQFYLMLQLGVQLLPHLGLPALYMGHAPVALLCTIIAASFTATAYGVCIGSLFQTPNQALPFGSISIVILSAIGGIWIPVEILPDTLQKLAMVSPLHWGLDAINTLFLRNGNLPQILPHLAALMGFSVFFLAVSGIVEQKRKR
jgi:ABC-2 type transport system permease protein